MRSCILNLLYYHDSRLAHLSYLLSCQETGEAIVIDPGRDIGVYMTNEIEACMEIRLIAAAETHIHSDFVSGLREAGAIADVTLYVSDEGEDNQKHVYLDQYRHHLLKDGDIFYIGRIKLEVLHR